jgi:hypothetical protein
MEATNGDEEITSHHISSHLISSQKPFALDINQVAMLENSNYYYNSDASRDSMPPNVPICHQESISCLACLYL